MFLKSRLKNMDELKKEWNDFHKNIKQEIYCDKDLLYFLHRLNCKNANILEIGCGQGRNLKYIKQTGGKCYGIDISDIAINKINGEYNLVCGDINKMPYEDDSFECVIDVVVLASISNPQNVINEIARVLKKGGLIFLKELTERNNKANPIFRRKNTYFYSYDELKKMFSNAKIKILETDISYRYQYQVSHYVIVGEKL
jgi:ubiquinone/menaquinone biosynthesis C-methylase UbiE